MPEKKKVIMYFPCTQTPKLLPYHKVSHADSIIITVSKWQ